MYILKPLISSIVALLLVLAGCIPTTPESTIEVPSFRKSYLILLEEAQKWRPDAYLHDARIFLFPTSSGSYQISAGFYSPSEYSESLAVDILQDGTITSEIFIHEYPIRQHKPITENDWKFDSQEAMVYMLDEAGQQHLNPNNDRCSFIVLERVLPLQNQPVIWWLAIWDCSKAAQHIYFDANSGKVLNPSVINMQPTRIPTSVP